MENNINQQAFYNESAAKLEDSMRDLQVKLDEFAKAADLLTASATIPVKFYNRVGIGKMTMNCSELTRSFFEHQDGLKTALTPKIESITQGEVSES